VRREWHCKFRFLRRILQPKTGMDEWFIKMYRSVLKWEWYDDIPAKVLFLHLLLTVNYADWRWHWIEVKKWCRITSLSKLSKECGLTLQQVRTAISKLKSTQEVTQFQHTDYTFLQVNNWDKYQWQSTQLPTRNQHRGNTEATTIEEGNKERKKEDTSYDESEEKIDLLITCWNETIPKWIQCRGITESIKTIWKRIRKKYQTHDEYSEAMSLALDNYVNDIKMRNKESNYYNHRFSLYEFLKQENWFQKFLNK
jgi:hypothetical protein